MNPRDSLPKVRAREILGPIELPNVVELSKSLSKTFVELRDRPRKRESLAAACGLLLGYPMFRHAIGDEWDQNGIRRKGYYELEAAHTAAITVLVTECERINLDGGPLVEYGRICRELFEENSTGICLGHLDTWPQCLGSARNSLPPKYQDAIRDGEAMLHRLNARLNLIDEAKEPLNKMRRQISPRSLGKISNPTGTISFGEAARLYQKKVGTKTADKTWIRRRARALDLDAFTQASLFELLVLPALRRRVENERRATARARTRSQADSPYLCKGCSKRVSGFHPGTNKCRVCYLEAIEKEFSKK